MTARIWSIAPLTLLCLLALATSVHAECAWVLWTTSYKLSGGAPVTETILPSEAYTTKGECDRTLERREAREDERRKSDPTRQRYFVCLPDTIDPRGPKGK